MRTDQGDDVSAQFVVMATGCLSSANTPDIAGLDTFAGDVFHTGRWPHEGVDFTGSGSAVIGTGSSGIQSIPVIAEQAAELSVFQRTASYTMPARNGPLDPTRKRRSRPTTPGSGRGTGSCLRRSGRAGRATPTRRSRSTT